MKTLTLIFSLSVPSLFAQQPQHSFEADTNRFIITVKNKVGFIDDNGNVAIQPQFQSAHEFSEGLCAVRANGRYGFIDKRGNICISAIYDYATEFKEGFALVFLDGKALFVNKEGEKEFQSNFKSMSSFTDGKSYVRTYTDKMGVIDKTGKLVVDTVFRYIGPFEDGRAMVTGLFHQPYSSEEKKRKLEVSVINETGQLIVPYGRFYEIDKQSEGYFSVSWLRKNKENETDEGIMNRDGKVIFTLPSDDGSWVESGVHDGIVRINLERKKPSGSWGSENAYDAYFKVNGERVYQDKDTQYGEDFSENFAFFDTFDGGFSLINRRGELIAKRKFNRIAGQGFQNGLALVKADDKWGVIDTTGNFISPPKFESVHESLLNAYIFFSKPSSADDDSPTYGIADVYGNEIIPPSFQYFDGRGFQNGLLKAWVDKRLTYFDVSGKIVWQQEKWQPENAEPLNIDYMNRGYFYANYSYTGHGDSPRSAEPESITMAHSFPGGVLSVIANSHTEYKIGESLRGMLVSVANSSGDSVFFNAQDNRLYMKMQARDATGQWRDIEYLPNSWCGNSYHSVALPENHYWTFIAPIYEGTIPVKLRIELCYIGTEQIADVKAKGEYRPGWEIRTKNTLVIYSNEFDGNVNPGQFWRKLDYSPNGIMDPYNE